MEKLPQIHPSHIQEKKSIQRLELALPKDLFILRAEDGGDYGVDRIIEVVKAGAVTNIRSHVQVKSSGKPQKKPGNFQFSVPISTLNYLLNSLNSIFLIYVEHEDQFYWDWVGTIAKERKAKEPASGKIERKTFSYNFSAKLDEQSILAIHERLISDTKFVKSLNLAKSPFEKVIITDFIHDRTYRDYLIMYTEEKYEKIIAIAKESLESSPIIYSLLALCYYNIYNYDEALKYILKAEQIKPDSAFKKIRVSILCEKGLKENNKRSLEQAKELFLSIESNEWGWMDFYNYGNVLSGLEEFEEAENCYRNAIRLEPNETTIRKNLSNVYKEQGKNDQELECLDTALTINPDLIEALICKGISLGQNFARFDEALVYLEKALRISKASMINNRSIYYWISEFRNSLRCYKASLDNVKEGLDYHPGDSYLENLKLRTLIVASEENIAYETEAIEMLEGIRSKYPSDLRITVELLKLLKRRKTGN